jgi:glucan phosphoethanolaminetransferase (alkaline phosphatase superfamily)
VSEPSAIRRALFRGIVVAFPLVVAFEIAGFLLVHRGSFWPKSLAFLLSGLMLGALAAPVASVEILASRWPPSRARDALAALASVLVALVGCFAAALQAAYTWGVVFNASPDRGLHELEILGKSMLHEPAFWLLWLLHVALPLGLVVVARLRGVRLWRQAWTTGRRTLVLALPCFLYLFHDGGSLAFPVFFACYLLSIAIGMGLPPLYWLADRLEDRLAARLAGNPTEPRDMAPGPASQ